MRKQLNLKSREIFSGGGFTVVEGLVTAVLFSVLLGICLNLLLSGSNSWQVNSTQTEVLEELIKTRDWMVRDLQQSGSAVITDVPANGTWYTTITFKKSNGVSNGSITWSGSTIRYLLNGNQLRRVSGGVNQTIAQGIQSLQIRRQATTPNIVEISVQGQKTAATQHVIAANLDFKLELRN